MSPNDLAPWTREQRQTVLLRDNRSCGGRDNYLGPMPHAPPTLLCVVNYPANTGYAWDFIEGLYAATADRLAAHGVRTLVAYPSIEEAPRALAGSVAQPVLLDASLATPASRADVHTLVRREHVTAVYYTDRPVWS